MKYKALIILVLSLLSNKITSQTNENVNPKGIWFFGAEMGLNTINSFSNGESKNSFQAGVLSEYYFEKNWSVSGRIKYYKTGVSFYNSGEGLLGFEKNYGSFNGAVISIPLDMKWGFRIYRNLGGNLKLGCASNFETTSKYTNYSENLITDRPTIYAAFNTGCGLNYFINKNVAIYFDFEYYNGGSKGSHRGILGTVSYTTTNTLMNFGIKYNFKKEKEIK